ncbi:MAG: tryptophan 7-halogenase [Chloroflexi bacterium]|nr:tryptophan 7-halogenase [Chloroflexota bacterium]
MTTINDRVKALSPEKREELAQLLQQKRASQPRKQVDVAILGGGLAGLTLARQLRRAHADLNILVVDKYVHPVPEAAFKVGESTVELGSYYFREVLGLTEILETTQLFKAGLRYYFPSGDNSDITRRVELGGVVLPPIRSHQLDRGRFENTLWDENQKQQIECWDDCNVREIKLGDAEHVITIRRHDQEEVVTARWVVDAAGRSSLLKRQLDLSESVDHNVNAVWFRIEGKIDIGTWSDDAEWRGRVPDGLRWLGTNHLMDRGYWTWLIPLAGDVTSVGIVADGTIHPHQEMNRFDRALDWLRHHEPQCFVEVESRKHLLQDFKVLKHYAHGCRRVFSPQRWAITGEAGVFLDPFYSPGSDFISMSNMIAKVVWDWACYWGVSALLFFHDNKLFDLAWAASMREQLQRFNALYVEMQQFFRQWSSLPAEPQSDKFVNILGFGCLEELYFGLDAKLNDEALKLQVTKNLAMLEAIAAECKAHGTIQHQNGVHHFGGVGVLAR